MSNVSPSSSHRVTVSSADGRLVKVDRRGRKPILKVMPHISKVSREANFESDAACFEGL